MAVFMKNNRLTFRVIMMCGLYIKICLYCTVHLETEATHLICMDVKCKMKVDHHGITMEVERVPKQCEIHVVFLLSKK